jgi:hypothetical protein
MDCGTFRENHGALLDESVSNAELAELRRHLDECAACAAHDTAVRRALLLFRNMPSIEPSSDFSLRLHERLRRIRAESVWTPAQAGHRHAYRGPGAGTFAGLAAGVIAAGYLIVAASSWAPAAGPLALAPVVSVAPATDPAADQATVMANAVANAVANTAASDLADPGRESDSGAIASLAGLAPPAFIAPVPAGSPVWPATVLEARAPARLATMQIKLTSLGR